MNNIGTQEIRTERLLLRKIKKSDYKDVFRYASREEVAKHFAKCGRRNIKRTIFTAGQLCITIRL